MLSTGRSKAALLDYIFFVDVALAIVQLHVFRLTLLPIGAFAVAATADPVAAIAEQQTIKRSKTQAVMIKAMVICPGRARSMMNFSVSLKYLPEVMAILSRKSGLFSKAMEASV